MDINFFCALCTCRLTLEFIIYLVHAVSKEKSEGVLVQMDWEWQDWDWETNNDQESQTHCTVSRESIVTNWPCWWWHDKTFPSLLSILMCQAIKYSNIQVILQLLTAFPAFIDANPVLLHLTNTRVTWDQLLTSKPFWYIYNRIYVYLSMSTTCCIRLPINTIY